MKFIPLIVLAALSLPAVCQKPGSSAQVFSAQQLAALEAQAKATGNGGATLGDYKTHLLKYSFRSSSGGAEMHAHFDDVIVVKAGSATLITGGSIINAHPAPDGSAGEVQGSGIRGGKSQQIATGDIVHIPAGTPHQMLLPPGGTFSAFVVKVRE